MYPKDFFTFLAKENSFEESNKISIRGHYTMKYNNKNCKIAVDKIIHPTFSKMGLDTFKINIPNFLIKKKLVKEDDIDEIRKVVMKAMEEIGLLVRAIAEDGEFEYIKMKDLNLNFNKEKKVASTGVLKDGKILIVASEVK